MTCVDSEQDDITQVETRCGVQNPDHAYFTHFFLHVSPNSSSAAGIYFSTFLTDIFNIGNLPQNIQKAS